MGGQNGWGGEDIAEQIRKALSQALETSNFDQLNRTIGNTVDSALGEAREQFEKYRNRADKRSGEPVDTQRANWVPEETDAGESRDAGSSSGGARHTAAENGGMGTPNAAAGGEDSWKRGTRTPNAAGSGEDGWKRGTRMPGDDGRYHYGEEAASGTAAGAYTDSQAWKSTYSSEPYTYGGQTQVSENTDYRVKWKGRISGLLMSAFGALGTSTFGMLTFLMLTISLIAIDGAAGWIMVLFLALVTGGFGLMLWSGIGRYGRVHRLKLYLDEIRRVGRPYCEVGRLGRAAGRGENFAKKDLRKILALGMLPDARMDENGTYLMMDAETYRQYEMSQNALKERQEQERLQKQQEEEKAREAQAAEKARKNDKNADAGGAQAAQNAGGAGASLDEAAAAAIARGEEQMETLDRLRQSLPACAMTDKLLRLDRVLERLFETLRKYPDQLDELERFMEYYLPTTVKLVTAYKEFASVEFAGDNINSAKKEIEETMDTINGAFEKLLDDMYEDTAFDVMTDASVLQTILKREGLTEGDFRKAADAAGGNETAAGGGNEVAAGGGSETAAGDGNETDAGGGNETAAGGGNETAAAGGK